MSLVFVFFYLSISVQKIFSLNRFCWWKSGFVATRWVHHGWNVLGQYWATWDMRLTVGTCGYWWYKPWILWHLRRCCWLRLAHCRLDSKRVGSFWLNVRMQSSGSTLEKKMVWSHWYTSIWWRSEFDRTRESWTFAWRNYYCANCSCSRWKARDKRGNTSLRCERWSVVDTRTVGDSTSSWATLAQSTQNSNRRHRERSAAGGIAKFLEHAGDGEGLLSWRRLVGEYEPAKAGRRNICCSRFLSILQRRRSRFVGWVRGEDRTTWTILFWGPVRSREDRSHPERHWGRNLQTPRAHACFSLFNVRGEIRSIISMVQRQWTLVPATKARRVLDDPQECWLLLLMCATKANFWMREVVRGPSWHKRVGVHESCLRSGRSPNSSGGVDGWVWRRGEVARGSFSFSVQLDCLYSHDQTVAFWGRWNVGHRSSRWFAAARKCQELLEVLGWTFNSGSWLTNRQRWSML